jgi:hypothetical protein
MLSKKWSENIILIEDIEKDHIIFDIHSDIIYDDDINDFKFIDYHYWFRIGFVDTSIIEDIIKDYDFIYNINEVKYDGEYKGTIILSKIKSKSVGYTYYVLEDKFTLIKTIEERKRLEKINTII